MRGIPVEMTARELEAFINAKDCLGTIADFFEKRNQKENAKEVRKDIKVLERFLKKYDGKLTESLMTMNKMCPYGAKVKAQCTPTRAEDCPKNDICGKAKRRQI